MGDLPSALWEHVVTLCLQDLERAATECAGDGPLTAEHAEREAAMEVLHRFSGDPKEANDSTPCWGFGGLVSDAYPFSQLRDVICGCLKLDALCACLRIRPVPPPLWRKLIELRSTLLPPKHRLLAPSTACSLLSLSPKQIATRVRKTCAPETVLALHTHMLLDERKPFLDLAAANPQLVLDKVCCAHYYWYVPPPRYEPRYFSSGFATYVPARACLALPATAAGAPEVRADAARLAGCEDGPVVEFRFGFRAPSRGISVLDVLQRERPAELLRCVSEHLQASDQTTFDRIVGC